MKKIFVLIVDTIIWLMLFELIIFFTGMSQISVLTVICAYTIAKVNYIEDEKEDD